MFVDKNDIKAKRIWTEISDQYNFPNMYHKPIVNKSMDLNTVEALCKSMEILGADKHPRIIASNIGIDWESLSEIDKSRYTNLVRKLRRRVVFKEINKKYNY